MHSHSLESQGKSMPPENSRTRELLETGVKIYPDRTAQEKRKEEEMKGM